MSADLTVPDHFTTQFSTNWKSIAQQKISRLRERCMVETGCTGERKSHNYTGIVSSENVTGQRYKHTALKDLPTAKRWVSPSQFQVTTGESKWDAIGLLPTVSPSGAHTLAHAGAFARDCDDVIIAALGGTSYTGAQGLTGTILPTTQKVAKNYAYSGGGTDTSLQVEKIIAALRILTETEAWNDDVASSGMKLHGVMTPRCEEYLRIDANSASGSRLFSRDFLPPVLDDQGRIKSFLGIDWTVSTRPGLKGSGVDYAYVWVTDGLQFDVWQEMQTTIDRLPQVSNAVQFLTQYAIGATRMEEEKVVEIAAKV
ncbi:phage capsid protein [Luteolibacter sp. LG18]|uniref:phage capsid protein n=1 Tax=Luteolibacter sp. LG18 TaxID=2819286 RepID=UPI002B2AF175|nr:hypothetical protein llg_26760 [Luteolibacter sp. LG18]